VIAKIDKISISLISSMRVHSQLPDAPAQAQPLSRTLNGTMTDEFINQSQLAGAAAVAWSALFGSSDELSLYEICTYLLN
jgi:hypothetical protein